MLLVPPARWLRIPLIALTLALGLGVGSSSSAQADPLTFVSGTIVGTDVTLTFSEALDATSVPSTSAFKVRTHGSSTVRRVSNVSISGSNVTFEISAFVDWADAATVEYCASGSNCGGAIRSQDGARTFTSYGALTPITTPGPAPKVSGATAIAYTIAIDFDRVLDESTVPATSAFTVDGFTTTVRKVVIASRKVTLHVVPPVPRWQHADSLSLTLTYTPPSTNSLRTPAPSAHVAAFDRRSIAVNNGKLVVSNLAVDGAAVALTFRVDIDESREPSLDQFKICADETTSDSSCTDATNIEISGKVVTVMFPSTALVAGTTVWLRYSGTRLRGSSGSRTEVRRIENHRIVLPSIAAPTLSSGAADGTTVVLTFDSALDSATVPAASMFEVDGTAVSAVAISGSQVTLTLTSAVAEGAAVSVEYTATGTTKLQGANSVAVATFTSSVTNNTDTAPVAESAEVTGASISITFDQDLDGDVTPATTTFAVSVDSQVAAISAVSLTDEVVELTLSSAADSDDVVTVSYTKPSTGGLQDETGKQVEPFGPLTATYTAPAAPSSATVDGATLTITFDEDLATTSAPLAAAFSVAGQTVSNPTVATRTVTLTLSPGVAEGATITVSYDPTQAGTASLRGTDGLDVAAFSALQVTNLTDTAPVLLRGSVNGQTTTLTFDQALDSTSVPPVVSQGLSTLSAFRVTVNEVRVGYDAIQVSGSSVSISLLQAVTPADVVKVQYQVQTNMPLQDTSSPANLLDSFDSVQVSNQTPMQPTASQVTGWTLTVTFNGTLDTDPLPAKSAFTVAAGADTLSVSSVAASGSTLTLRLTAAVSRTATVQVTYTAPMTNPLQDVNERSIAAFSLSAANNTPTAATVSSAVANGESVTVAFARSLSSESTNAVSAFTVNSQAPTAAEIDNGKLKLTVSPAIAEGAAVTVAYTPSAAAKLLDEHGIVIAAFSTSATNNTDTAPAASTATATAWSVKVVFDQNLDSTSTPPKTAFSLGSGGPTVSAISISTNTVTLSVACCVLHGAMLTLAYTPDSSAPLRDSTGNSVSAFTISITNQARQGPSVSSASVVGNELTLRFSAALKTTSKPSATSFTITAGALTVSVSSVTISDRDLTLELSSSIPGHQSVSLAYQLPTANPISASDGEIAAPFSSQTVDNRSPPLLTSATVDGAALTLQFDTTLNEGIEPDVADFTLNGASASSLSVSGGTVEITLAAAVAEGVTIRLGYTPSEEDAKGIEGTNSIRLGALATLDVENQTDTTPVVASATVNLTQLQVVFDQALDSTSVPAVASFTVGATSVAVQSAQISGNTLTLTLAQAVVEGATVTLAYAPPAANALQDATGNQVAQFSTSVQNQTDTAPILVSSSVNGATATLTFDQSLDAMLKPAVGQLAVTATTVQSIAISGSSATLTLSSAIADGTSTTLQYTQPSSGGFQDATGNAVASFTVTLTNQTDTAPSPSSAVIPSTGLTLAITFNEALSEAAADLPPAGQFSLTGTSATVASVAVSGSTVTLTFGTSVKEGATVTVAYVDTDTKKLRDLDQGQLATAAFSITATNQVDYAASPASAEIDGTALTITFDQALDATATVAATSFSVMVGGASRTVSGVSMSGVQATLTLGQAATAADTVQVSYTMPASGGLHDLSNLATASFGPLTVTNRTPPVLQSAVANGSTVTLTFNATLDAQSQPPASAFSVTSATVSSVTISGSGVTLGLATTVHETTSLSLHYTRPAMASQRLKGSNGAEVKAISTSAVQNQTDTTPIVRAAIVNLNRGTLTFDQDLDTSSTPAASHFTLNGSTETVTAVVVENNSLTGIGEARLTFSGDVKEGAAISIEYQLPTSGAKLQDPEGNAVAAFNATADNTTDTAPAAVSGSVDGDAAVVTLDQPLDTASTPAASTFSLAGTTATVPSVQLENSGASGVGSVKLSLSQAVKEGESVSITYAAPSAADLAAAPGLRYLRDQQRNAASISNFALTNLTDTVPAVASATVDGTSLTVEFDQALDPSSVPSAASFSLTSGPTVSAVAINGNDVQLTLASAVSDGAAVRLSYTRGSGNRLRDGSGNDAPTFTMDMDNETDTAPHAVSAATDTAGESLTLTMNEAVKESSGTGALKDAFTLEGSGAEISSITINGATVTLNFAVPSSTPDCFTSTTLVHELDQITLKYAPASGGAHLADADQNETAVAAFEQAVTNNVDTRPIVRCDGVTIDANLIIVEFDQPLKDGTGPPYLNDIGVPLNAFRIWVNNALREFQDTTIVDGKAQIVPTQSVSIADDVDLQYQDQQLSPLVGTSGSEHSKLAMSFDRRDVDNSTPAAPTAAEVDGDSLEVTFDAALGSADPAATAFAVSSGDQQIVVDAATTSESKLTLALNSAVAEGATVRVQYTPPQTTALEDGSERRVRAFLIDVTNVTDTAPAVASALANRDSISVQFDQSLAVSASTGDFSVSDGGATIAVTAVDVDGADLTLTLSRSVGETTTVRVRYTKPATGGLADATNNTVASFDVEARNTTGVGPVPVSAEVRLTELVVTFDEPLDAASLPAVDAFSIVRAPRVVEVVKIRGSVLTLRLDDPGAGPDSRIRLTYAPGGDQALRDHRGNPSDGFRISVVDRGAAPKPISALAVREVVTIRFDGPLSSRHVPPRSWWFVVGQELMSVTAVSVGGHTVSLVLEAPGLPEGESVSVAYAPRHTGTGALRSLAGHRVPQFGIVPTNHSRLPPKPVEANADGTALVVEFSEEIEPGATRPEWFEVSAGHRAIALVAAAWSTSRVELTLEHPVTTRDSVILRYAPAPGDGARDTDGERLEAFEIQVDNETPLAPTLEGRLAAAQARAHGDPTAAPHLTLQRELIRELGWRGGVYALVDPDADGWERIAHESGAPAFTLREIEVPATLEETRIEVRPVGNRSLLSEVFDMGELWRWTASVVRPWARSVWRIDLAEPDGALVAGSADLDVELALPSSEAPLAVLIYDLLDESWRRVEYKPVDGIVRLRVAAPGLVVFAALPLRETTLWGVTLLVFDGAPRPTPQEFARALDESVIGIGIQDRPGRHWSFVAVDDPASYRPLHWGEQIVVVRRPGTEPLTVSVPAAMWSSIGR